MLLTPKTAKKHQRRQHQVLSTAQLAKIMQHLQNFIQEGETPAIAVKRLLVERHEYAKIVEEIAKQAPTVLDAARQSLAGEEAKEETANAA